MKTDHMIRCGWLVVCLLSLWGLLGSLPAQAQAPITMSQMTVALWPEHDKAGVLVIVRGVLASDVPLPAALTFALPASAGAPSAMAGVDEAGEYHYYQWSTKESDGQLLATFSTPYRQIQVEYYYDPLTREGAERRFAHSYTLEYAVQDFSLEVEEPTSASDFQATPAADRQEAGANALLHVWSLGQAPAGHVTQLSVSYRNESGKLTSEVLGLPTPGQASFEEAPAAKPQQQPSSWLLAVAVVMGVAAVTFGTLTYARSQKRPGKDRARQAAKPAGKATPARTEKSGAASAFCHRCGRGLKTDERFCPACGAPRKTR